MNIVLRFLSFLIVISIVGCSTFTSKQSPSASATGPAVKSTKLAELETGDQIEFIYSGKMYPRPAVMIQTVLKQDKAKMDLAVEFQVGAQKRKWRQLMTFADNIKGESAKNQKISRKIGGGSVLTELLEYNQGRYQRLANSQNQDLERLYSGAYLKLEGTPELVSLGAQDVVVCGQKIPALIKVVRQSYQNQPMLVKTLRSPDFKWDQIRTDYVLEKSKQTVLRIDAKACRKTETTAKATAL